MSRQRPGRTLALPELLDAVYRAESGRILATLIRLLGDFDLAGDAMQDAFAAALERWPKDRVPENPRAWKEQLGGILILEARDLNHAIQLMSKHPGVKAGPFEIRPAADLSEMIRENEKRRAKP